MTPGMKRVLQYLLEHKDTEDDEIVCEGIECWMGDRRVHRKTVNELLYACAISDTSMNGEGLQRYIINDTGEALLKYPDLEDALFLALRGGKSFSIREGKIVYLEENPNPRPRPRTRRR